MRARRRSVLVALALLGLSLQAVAQHAHGGAPGPGAPQLAAAQPDASAPPASLHDASTCFACRGGKERQRLAVPPSRSDLAGLALQAVARCAVETPVAPEAPALAAGGPRAPPRLPHFTAV